VRSPDESVFNYLDTGRTRWVRAGSRDDPLADFSGRLMPCTVEAFFNQRNLFVVAAEATAPPRSSDPTHRLVPSIGERRRRREGTNWGAMR
jgi:hypothetical protein